MSSGAAVHAAVSTGAHRAGSSIRESSTQRPASSVAAPACASVPTAGEADTQPLLASAPAPELESDVYYCLDGELIPESAADAWTLMDGREFRTSCCMTPVNPFRAVCIRVLCHKRLDSVVMAVVLFNSVYMLLETPKDEESRDEAANALVVEWACMSFFTIEMLIRVVAVGLVGHEQAFVYDP